jgi:hypothetical protein
MRELGLSEEEKVQNLRWVFDPLTEMIDQHARQVYGHDGQSYDLKLDIKLNYVRGKIVTNRILQVILDL